MNGAVRGRRLARPVRLTLAMDLGTSLAGAWWPHTASIARELPELIDALFSRLGEIVAIKVNWSSLEGSPDLDAMNGTRPAGLGQRIGHQRLMMVTGCDASANLLVVPCRTSTPLAIMVLRQAASFPIMPFEQSSREFRTGEHIVVAARAESVESGQCLPDAGMDRVDAQDPVLAD